MFEKLYNLKQRKTKGFTLVELIVVLIILGILAALLLPTLTGYIDQAQDTRVTAECRMGVMAAKSVGAQVYEDARADKDKDFAALIKDAESVKKIKELAEYKNDSQNFQVTYDANANVLTFVYTDGAKTVTYDGSKYDVTDGAGTNSDTASVSTSS